MSLVKQILQSAAVQSIISAVVSAYAATCRLTSRVHYHGLDNAAEHWRAGRPVILSIWHGRLLLMPYLFKGVNKPPYALISDHRDGQLISKSASWFNVRTVHGSTAKGGARALKEMLRLARDGHTLFITPDGPRGPRMQATSGVVDVARISGLAIIPCTISTSHGRFAKSWDRFLLPYPFGTIHILFGAPVVVAKDTDKASKAATVKSLEQEMIRLQREADRHARRPERIEPAQPDRDGVAISALTQK